MLSRLFAKSALKTSSCLRVVAARLNSTNAPSANPSSDIKIVDMSYPKRLMDWENFKMPGEPYVGMGPLPPLMDYDENTCRHYFIPESWVQYLRPKTGETGLYALFAGLAAFAVSKELYIVGPDSVYVVGFIITYGLVLKYAGPYFRDVFEDLRLGQIHSFDEVKANEMKELIQTVDEIKVEQWRAQGQEFINDARRSNLAMMLETEYLNRQATVVETVKKLLDYQVAVQKAEIELEQEHMVKWIEQKVKETITPETQKATLSACIAQLNAMAAK